MKGSSVEAVHVELTIHCGEDLAAKDRNVFGRRTTSDPYINVSLLLPPQQHQPRPRRQQRYSSNEMNSVPTTNTATTTRRRFIGKTKIVYKNLSPHWNEDFCWTIDKPDLPQQTAAATSNTNSKSPVGQVELAIYDHDQLSSDDLMGVVTIPLPSFSELQSTSTTTTTSNINNNDHEGYTEEQQQNIHRRTNSREVLVYCDRSWYKVPPTSAPHASGRIQISCVTTCDLSHNLVRGNVFDLFPHQIQQQPHHHPSSSSSSSKNSSVQQRNQQQQQQQQHMVGTIVIGLAWDRKIEPSNNYNNNSNSTAVDLDVSLVAITTTGNHISLPDTVYYGNLSNPDRSIIHSGDEQTGDATGDDERIVVHLDQLASSPRTSPIIALYVLVTVATPHLYLSAIQSARLRIVRGTNTTTSGYHSYPYQRHYQEEQICAFYPSQYALHENATAMFMARISKQQQQEQPWTTTWVLEPMQDTHASARDFGTLIPYMKHYSKDLIPDIVVRPNERIAILQKGGNINLGDYYSDTYYNNNVQHQYHLQQQHPRRLCFGLAWDITDGVDIDLDASVLCLDANLQLVDTVWFTQLQSNDGAIFHHGDERRGAAKGDDEVIQIDLGSNSTLNPAICYLGFVINSYSGQELDDVAAASCHLYDPISNIDIARYHMTNVRALDKHTALLVACLYRNNSHNHRTLPTSTSTSTATNNDWSSWGLCILSEPAMGKRVHDNLPDLQYHLRRRPLQVPPPRNDEPEIKLCVMPAHVPLVPNDQEIDLSSSLPPQTLPTTTTTALSQQQYDCASSPPVVTGSYVVPTNSYSQQYPYPVVATATVVLPNTTAAAVGNKQEVEPFVVVQPQCNMQQSPPLSTQEQQEYQHPVAVLPTPTALDGKNKSSNNNSNQLPLSQEQVLAAALEHAAALDSNNGNSNPDSLVATTLLPPLAPPSTAVDSARTT